MEFDGTGISVFELKRDIIIKSGLGDGTEFDLAIYNEDGNEGEQQLNNLPELRQKTNTMQNTMMIPLLSQDLHPSLREDCHHSRRALEEPHDT